MIFAIIGVIYVGYYKSNSSTVLRVASGERNSHAFEVGKDLKQAIETHSDFKVELVESGHSAFNRGVVQSGKADIAFISPSATDMTNLSVIAPIDTKYLHVIVREELNIASINGLAGRRISLGGDNSDHRKAAYKLLEHYQVERSALRNTQVSHLDLLEGRNLDGAIIQASFNDEYVQKLMSSGKFKLLAVTAAEGLAKHNPYYQSVLFPLGVYPSVYGPMPADWMPTISENTWIVSRMDLPEDIVEIVIDVMRSKSFSLNYPLLATWLKENNGQLDNLVFHEAAEHQFNPYQALKTNVFETLLVAWNMKWLILFLIILIWNARSRWVGMKTAYVNDRKTARLQRIQALLEDVNSQEQQQANTKDYRLLMNHLSEVRRIKAEGITVAKDQKMSDSAVFLSFLQQCDHVSRDIQWKLSLGIKSNEQLN